MVVVRFHLESQDDAVVWSADSQDVPSLHVVSPRLRDCQRLALMVLGAEHLDASDVVYQLAECS